MGGFIYKISVYSAHFLAWSWFAQVVAIGAPETHCEVKPEVSGTHSDITCYFPINLNKTQTGFCLNHYGSLRTDTVLTCIWLDGNLRCETKKGYYQPKEVSHKLNIVVNRLEGGEFGCDTLPADRRTVVNICPIRQGGFAEPPGDSQANVRSVSKMAKDNITGNNDEIEGDDFVPWICSLCLIISVLILWIFLMKRYKSTEVFKIVLQQCRSSKQKRETKTSYTKSEVPDDHWNSVEGSEPLNEVNLFHKLETQNDYQRSLVKDAEQVSTQPDYIGAITIRPFISVSDERQTPDENKPLSPHLPEKAPSPHQNGSVKQSSPFNDISMSVQRRTPDEEQPWSSSGPEKF